MVKFKIRAIPDIDETLKIAFKGRQYNITSIDNIKYENKYMEVNQLSLTSRAKLQGSKVIKGYVYT